MIRLLIFVTLLSACTVKAGNPGDGKADVEVVALHMEDRAPANGTARLLRGDQEIASMPIDSQGRFKVVRVEPGMYILALGKARQAISVGDTSQLEFLVPVPAIPRLLRGYRLEENRYCLLWNDVSGLEDGYGITGTISGTAPKNAFGLLLEGPAPMGEIEIAAFNEFGASAPVRFDLSGANTQAPLVDWNRCTNAKRSGQYLIP